MGHRSNRTPHPTNPDGTRLLSTSRYVSMNIAYVYDAIYPFVTGGVEKRIYELSSRLTRRGHEIHLYGMQFWDGEATFWQDGICYHGVSPAQPFYTQARRSIIPPLAFAIRLSRDLRAGGHDLIDCQNFPYFPSFAARRAAREIPLIITWHEVWGEYWYRYLGRYGIFGRMIEDRSIHLADRLIAVSQRTINDLRGHGVRGEINYIPNGIDRGAIDMIKPSGEGGDLIFSGRLIREKHVDLILSAVSILVRDMPDLSVVIIGDGPERKNLEHEKERRGLDGNVLFTGFLPDWEAVIGSMKSSSLFILPSTREGFGIAALEAMACGIPVVTINHPQNAVVDLIEGGCGLCCRFDPIDLAETISSALDRQEELGAAAKEKARAYDWEDIVDSIEEIYQNTVKRGRIR